MTAIRQCILIVEDDVDIAFVIGDVLERSGYAVATVGDGAEALDWLRANPAPGLILLDLMMPGVSGWEFREAQLRDPTISSIPVVVMSGANQLEEKTAALHPAGIVRKPINTRTLIDTTRKHYTVAESPSPK